MNRSVDAADRARVYDRTDHITFMSRRKDAQQFFRRNA